MNAFSKGLVALSLLVLPVSTAFAEQGDGRAFQPAQVASPASGPARGASVYVAQPYNQGQGGQAETRPVTGPVVRGPSVAAGSFGLNAGLNG